MEYIPYNKLWKKKFDNIVPKRDKNTRYEK